MTQNISEMSYIYWLQTDVPVQTPYLTKFEEPAL
jgi:hypothetical protein